MFNFPNAPTEGQTYTPVGGYQYVYLDGVWRVVEAPQDVGTAQTRNRIVNGAMQVSQEYGVMAPTAMGVAGAVIYIADQFAGQNVSGATAATVSVRTDVPHVDFTNRIRFNTGSPADAAVAAADTARIIQFIEGTRVSDFNWGTANARQVILRFVAKSSLAGTFCVAIQNGDSPPTRSWIKNCVLAAANTDQEFTLVVPGDVTGTWATGNAAGFKINWTFMAGTTSQGAEGWQAGNLTATSACTNFLATASSTFELGKVGLYLDPLATGIAPPWVMPDEAEELRACKRYFGRYFDGTGNNQSSALMYGSAGGPTAYCYHIDFNDEMRVFPAMTTSIGHSLTNCTAAAWTVNTTSAVVRSTVTALGQYRALMSGYVYANARM